MAIACARVTRVTHFVTRAHYAYTQAPAGVAYTRLYAPIRAYMRLYAPICACARFSMDADTRYRRRGRVVVGHARAGIGTVEVTDIVFKNKFTRENNVLYGVQSLYTSNPHTEAGQASFNTFL